MQIGFVHPSYPSSEGTGATHSATRIVEGLVDRGHKVVVYCTGSPGEDELKKSGLITKTIPIKSGHLRHTAFQRNQYLREHTEEFARFDVVHSYVLDAIPALGELGRTSDTSTVQSLNAYRGVCPKNDLRYMGERDCRRNGPVRCGSCILQDNLGANEYADEGFIYGTGRALYDGFEQYRRYQLIRGGRNVRDSIDAFQALSPHIKRKYEDFGYPSDQIAVISNILDERFNVTHESEFTEPYRLLYVGFLREHKGVEKLIPVLEKLLENGEQSFELSIVGGGGMQTSIEKDVREVGLEDQVTVRGHINYDNLPSIYASHDIFLYPGKWEEPFSRTWMEALATGTPIVASDVGDISDIVGDAGVVTDGTVDGLSEAISKLVQSPDKLQNMSDNAAEQTEKFRATRVINKLEQLYQNIP